MERSFSVAIAAMRISDKGRVTPFLFSSMERAEARCHSFFVISIYGRLTRMSKILFFSLSDFIPWRISNVTIPHVETALSMRSISRWSAVFDPPLKNSIQMVVSTSILFFKDRFSLFLSLHFTFFFLFPVVVDSNFSFEGNHFLIFFCLMNSCMAVVIAFVFDFSPEIFCTSARRSSGMFNVARILKHSHYMLT